MSNVIALPPVPKEEVGRVIKEIATQFSERVFILDHALMRMNEREITSIQVFKVLRLGDLDDSPTWDSAEERGWRCRFSRIVAGEKITVVAKLVERDNLSCLVVTVW